MNEPINLRADALLAANPRPKDANYFIEATFQYKLRREKCHPYRTRREPIEPTKRLVMRAEWRQIIQYSRLTKCEHDVLAGYLAGDTFKQLAMEAGISKQAIYKAFSKAVEKIRVAYHVYPYAGLSDVFLAEINRGRRTQNRGCASD